MGMVIETAFGRKHIVRRVGPQREFYQDTDHQWWTVNPQHGWVPVPSNSRALRASIPSYTTQDGDN